jgi:hypothetical protein
LPWLKDNVPFPDRTARDYMRCFQHRAKLANVASLSNAYALIAGKGAAAIA